MENNALMSIEDAANYLSLKRSSLYQMSMRKSIPIVRIGRLIRFRKSDLDSFIEQRCEAPLNAPLTLPTL